MTALSIITPIFNKADFLPDLFENILQQSIRYSDFELILINDGSSDNSEIICKDFIMNHPELSIKYFYQSNSGVSCARNKGIELSSGEWIHFMDCDDKLESHSYNIIFKKYVEDNLDYIGFGFKQIDLRNKKKHKQNTEIFTWGKEELYYNGRECIRRAFYPSSSVTGLYKREFLIKHDIKFPVDINIGEDLCFNSDFFLHNPKIKYIPISPYLYFFREGSAMTNLSGQKAFRWIENYLIVLKHHLKLSLLNPEISHGLTKVINHHLKVFAFKVLQLKLSYKDFRNLTKVLKDIGLRHNFNDTLKSRMISLIYSYPPLYLPVSYIYRTIRQ